MASPGPRITVVELRNACLSLPWRRAWLRGQNPPPFTGLAGRTKVFGSTFHRLAEELTAWLCGPGNTNHAVMDAGALWNILYDRWAGRDLKEICSQGLLAEASELRDRLRSFCAHLVLLRAELPEMPAWNDLFLGSEHAVRDAVFDCEGGPVTVAGRIDAIRRRPGNELVIVDYKLTRGALQKHDLLQLAIYAAILEKARPGLRFHGMLEYYEPAVHTVTATPGELQTIFQNMVMPVLEELAAGPTKPAGPAKGAVSDKPVDGVTPAGPEETSKRCPRVKQRLVTEVEKGSAENAVGEATEDDHSAAIQNCYAAFKLEVTVTSREPGPQLIRYRVKPATGVKVISLINRADDLQVALSLTQPPLIEPGQGCVTVDIPKERPDPVWWRDIMTLPEVRDHPGPVSFPVGLGVDGRVIVADFGDPNMAHMLVAGASGSGKSEFLKSMTASLISRNPPERLRLTLVDPKVLTFGPLKNSPHLTQPVITSAEDAVKCLERAVADMEKRYRQLFAEEFENIGQRYAAGKTDLPWHVLIFDEYADLVLAGKDERKQFETLAARLAAKGRAAGIHLVLATQRPERNIVTGLIKSNLPLRICLRVAGGVNSQIVIDDTGGASLLGRGDLLCDRGKRLERAQSPYISGEELAVLARGKEPAPPGGPRQTNSG